MYHASTTTLGFRVYFFCRFFIIIFIYFSGEAEKAFINLKKRYSKKKIKLRRSVAHSGWERTHEVIKAEKDFTTYTFLEWINPFLAGPEGKVSFIYTSLFGDLLESAMQLF